MDKHTLLNLLRSQGITSEAVLKAIDAIPRERFVPVYSQSDAYENHPLPIGHQQTISQPFVIARMTEILLRNHPMKILEVGTGSGYQAAVLSQLVNEVYTVERIEALYKSAKKLLDTLGYSNIHIHHGDGFLGWEDHAPYDAIIVTAAAPEVPDALLHQLKDQGQLLLPVGEHLQPQQLKLITKQGKTYHEEKLDPVMFVPLLHGKESFKN